jgi:hypothetical protein
MTMKVRNYARDPRLGRLHQDLTAPDAREARRKGLVDRGTPPPRSDREFGLTSTEVLKGIGHSTAKKLERMGIVTVSQLAHSERDLAPLGAQAQSVLDVRTSLQQTLTQKERTRREELASVRSIGDLPKLPASRYLGAASEQLRKAWPFDGDAPDTEALAEALGAPQVMRRTYLPDGTTPVRAYMAEFDLAGLGLDARLRCVHEGEESFRVWVER